MGITCKPMGILKKLIVADANKKAKEAAANKHVNRGKKSSKAE